MKCSYCEQEMAEDAKFCPNCGKEKVVVVETTEPQAQVVENKEAITRKYGFDGALKATIFGTVSFFTMLFALFLSVFVPLFGLMSFIAGVVFAIIGIVKGARGIKDFMYANNTARVKPVATLVLGIVGVIAGAIALFYGIFVFIGIAAATMHIYNLG